MADGLKFRPIASNRAPYISVESEPGCGTTFRIEFPRTEARLLETGIPDEKQADLSPASGRILLVEDNPEIRRLYHNTFTAAGFQLIEAESGKEALMLSWMLRISRSTFSSLTW
jgi:hypothetical protein